MTWRIDLAYDGTPFSGWARQEGLPTVQGEIEAALATALGTDVPVELTVAGRTDAGVHALGQVASFEFDGELPDDIVRSMNGLTPRSISVFSVGPAPEGFSARRDARSRTYCYQILARPTASPFLHGRAWWIRRNLDRALLDSAASALVGEHDFTAFTPTDTYHRRFHRIVESAHWEAADPFRMPGDGPSAEPGLLRFWITGDTFMRSMVRILVGTMVEVGSGERPLDDFTALLGGAPREAAGQTAPAEGLFLVRVAY